MGPVMMAHVYEFLGFAGTAEGGLAHRFRRSHKSDYRAVCGFTGIHVKDFHAFNF
jgi:hypothetical protein